MRACRKFAYLDQIIAEEAAKRNVLRKGWKTRYANIYFCEDCGKWHLTSQKKENNLIERPKKVRTKVEKPIQTFEPLEILKTGFDRAYFQKAKTKILVQINGEYVTIRNSKSFTTLAGAKSAISKTLLLSLLDLKNNNVEPTDGDKLRASLEKTGIIIYKEIYDL